MKLCIKNGTIVNPASGMEAKGDLWISGREIVCIKTEDHIEGKMPKTEGVRVMDAKGKLVVPGLVDLHVHFREPGFEYKESIETGCKAAAAGGVTAVCTMPNTKPVVDGKDVVKYIDDKARAACGVHVLPIGAVTLGQKGEALAPMEEMAGCNTDCKVLLGRGICAVSEDGKSVMNSALMLSGMEAAKAAGLPVFSHTEDSTLAGRAIGEELIVARDIMLAKESGCLLHLCHISTKGSIEIIRRAKAAGISVTAETAPHYFTFTEEDEKGSGNRKMNPPLRGQADRQAVKDALLDGTIDVIATDHAPHHKDEKQISFEKAAFGVTGLETSFAAGYTMLVKNGIMTVLQLVDAMSLKPARILGLDRGDISVGKVADIAIFDIEGEHEIAEAGFQSKSTNSPFIGMRLTGRTVMTIVDGKIIMEA